MIPLNYHHLYYFWTVARCGSIAAATAEALSLPARAQRPAQGTRARLQGPAPGAQPPRGRADLRRPRGVRALREDILRRRRTGRPDPERLPGARAPAPRRAAHGVAGGRPARHRLRGRSGAILPRDRGQRRPRGPDRPAQGAIHRSPDIQPGLFLRAGRRLPQPAGKPAAGLLRRQPRGQTPGAPLPGRPGQDRPAPAARLQSRAQAGRPVPRARGA